MNAKEPKTAKSLAGAASGVYVGALAVALFVLTISLVACRSDSTTAQPGPFDPHPRDIQGMPALWLGEEYDEDGDGDGDGDLPLVFSRELSAPPIIDPNTGKQLYPAQRRYQFGYGRCEIPEGATGCPIPITISIFAPCFAEPLAPEVREEVVTSRGVPAVVYGGGAVRIDTDEFSIQVHAVGEREDPVETGKQRALKVIENLRPANEEAAGYEIGRPFKPPASGHLCER